MADTDNENLPGVIMAWQNRSGLWWLGSWATTRYPEEAVPYVPQEMLAEAREAALREAAEVAESRWQSWPEGHPAVSCDATACENIATAILALIEKDKP